MLFPPSFCRDDGTNPVSTQYFRELEKTPPDSEIDSSDDDSDLDSLAHAQLSPRRSRGPQRGSGDAQAEGEAGSSSGWWWCNVL